MLNRASLTFFEDILNLEVEKIEEIKKNHNFAVS